MKDIGSIMNIEGIKNFYVPQLIRFDQFRECLSFSGGEAQRLAMNSCKTAVSDINLLSGSLLYDIYKKADFLKNKFRKFLSPSKLFFLTNVPSTKVTRKKGLFSWGKMLNFLVNCTYANKYVVRIKLGFLSSHQLRYGGACREESKSGHSPKGGC